MHRVGIEIGRAHGTLSHVRQELLSSCDGALDIGANVGQWGRQLRRGGFHGRILSIEPESENFRALLRASAGDPKWTAFRAAISDLEGSATLHVSGNSVSSSLQTMLPSHEAAAATSAVVSDEQVPLWRLDRVLEEVGWPSVRPYLKVDTQGHELHVLQSAPDLLSACAGIEMELSLQPLYADQPLMHEVLDYMYERNFIMIALEKVFSDPHSGHVLQVDGLFVPRELDA